MEERAGPYLYCELKICMILYVRKCLITILLAILLIRCFAAGARMGHLVSFDREMEISQLRLPFTGIDTGSQLHFREYYFW